MNEDPTAYQPEPREPESYQPPTPQPYQPYAQPQPYQPTPTPVTPPAQAGYQQPWAAAPAPASTPLYGATTQPTSPAPINSYAPAGATFVSSFGTPGAPKRSRRPLFAGLAVLVAVILAGTGTYVFGFYIPGRPDNVWRSGLANTGTALTGLTNDLTDKGSLAKFDKTKVSGTFSINDTPSSGTATSVTGKVDSTQDGSSFSSSISATAKTDTTTNIGAQIEGQVATGATYPSIFVKLTGLDALASDPLYGSFASLNNQWISISSDEIASISSQDAAANDKQLTSDDAAGFAKAINKAVSQDVFTTDPKKSVFTEQSFVGHETKNGRTAYHYKATLNQANAKSFCSDILTDVSKTSLYTKLKSSDDSLSRDINDCQDGVKDNQLAKKPFDIWVDSQDRILTAIRFDNGDGSGTDEIGQKLGDNNKVSLYLTGSGIKNYDGDQTVTMVLDRTSLNSTFDMHVAGTDADTSDKFKVDAHATFAPFSGSVPFTKPTTSTDVESIFGPIFSGADSFSTNDSLTGSSTSDLFS